jgi:hypothetical protein
MSFEKQQMARVVATAKENLKDHVITQLHKDGEGGRRWLCSRPQSSVYRFHVYAPPGWLMITGDMGECMWSRVYDMLAFVRQSIGSLGYFSEKVTRDIEIKEYHTELVEEWFKNFKKEWKESYGEKPSKDVLGQLADLRESWENYNDPQRLQMEIYEGIYDYDSESIPSFKTYKYHYLWKIEALKWFIAKIDAGQFDVDVQDYFQKESTDGKARVE